MVHIFSVFCAPFSGRAVWQFLLLRARGWGDYSEHRSIFRARGFSAGKASAGEFFALEWRFVRGRVARGVGFIVSEHFRSHGKRRRIAPSRQLVRTCRIGVGSCSAALSKRAIRMAPLLAMSERVFSRALGSSAQNLSVRLATLCADKGSPYGWPCA